MKDKINFDEKTAWTSKIGYLSLEIVKWSITWNYYLLIPVDKLTEDHKSELLKFDWYNDFLDPIDFHGGVTYYSEVIYDGHSDHFNNKSHFIKIGCDYAHLYDREVDYYDIDYVKRECIRTAEQALKLLPELKEVSQ